MGYDSPSKVFYKVGEVSQLVGVESYVLRYWEKMFPQLSPEKDESGQRVYTRPDIDVILHIKNLLYEERYTIDGARKKLKEESAEKGQEEKSQHDNAKDVQVLLATLKNVRNILQEASVILEKE
jgi:DNA-binding transcriptional MerR regulator